MSDGWRELANSQQGVVSRRQLYELEVTREVVRAQVRAGRWAWRTESVLTTTTGPLSWDQRLWVAVLHCGPGSAIGGLTAAEIHGLRNWDREQITVLVDDDLSFAPIEGFNIFRTRRGIPGLLDPASDLPLLRVEPAVLLFAAYDRSRRTAQGVLAAVVQQGLTTPDRLRACLASMRPLRRAADFRAALSDLEGGAQSLAEMDVRRACRRFAVVLPHRQRPRVDRAGKRRWTDCEWDLPDGVVLVLEVDGAFHLEVRQYSDDMKRQRRLTARDRMIVRCSATELRDEPGEVMADLIALGVPRTNATGTG
jgi:hypothetical protein